MLEGGRHLETREGRRAAARTSPEAIDFLREGGWTIVYPQYGSRAGVSAHPGVLHPDEYVDEGVLRAMVEHELGFTYEQVRSVYRGRGRRTAAQIALRARIDARLYDVRRAGGNLERLARAIGIDRKKVVGRALARARAIER